MKWKDSYDTDVPEDTPEDDVIDDEMYSPWNAKSRRRWLSRLSGRSVLPYIVGAAGLLVLLVTIGGMFADSDSRSYDRQIEALEDRVELLERRLGDVETAYADAGQIEALDREIEQVKGRFDRMEGALSLKMDLVLKKVEKSAGRISTAERKKTAPTPSGKSKQESAPKETAKKSPPERIHVVSAGDTLFSISRRYDLSVDDLLNLNGLEKDEAIHPGQRLVVAR
jgi:hypothetical protein